MVVVVAVAAAGKLQVYRVDEYSFSFWSLGLQSSFGGLGLRVLNLKERQATE